MRRAEAVQGYLVQQGLGNGLVRAVGYGEDRPVVAGAAAQEPGAELNRRVVFVIEGGSAAMPMEQPVPSGEAT
jgi:outer membrane protein OmpA-like peptidoglycan-associated protein